jgi:hypothetical protein
LEDNFTYTTPENILEGWKKHFETLATPAKNDTKNYTNTEFDLDLIYEIYTEIDKVWGAVSLASII